jgi:phosphoglycolate phosphatase
MYQLLLFDLDGTLTDPKEGISKSFQYALAHFGIEEDINNLNRVIGPPLIDSFMEYYGFDRETGQQAVEKYRERFSTLGIYENALYSNVKEMLSALKKAGKTIALATSKPHVFAERILKHFDIYDYFDVIVGAELDGKLNYKNEIIAEVFRRLHFEQKERAIMIGDRRQDIDGAKQNGIASLGVKFGYAEPGELEDAGADYLVNSVLELQNFLLR